MRAWFYDGETATRHEVGVAVEDGALALTLADGGVERVDAGAIVPGDDRADARVFGHRDRAGWRLGIPKPLPAELAAVLPREARYGGVIDRIGLWPAAAAAAALSASVLAVGWLAPAWLTPLVPESWERSYGEALVGDFGGKYCAGAEGLAALGKLATRLDPESGDLTIRVVDLAMVNAAALPGKHIVLFRGLIDTASGPDEVAGVLAHEIAHVRRRHVTEALLRQFGVGIVLATIGGSTAANIEGVLSLSYSRSAEGEADSDAIATLARAAVSPAGTAAFFAKLGRMDGRFDAAFAYLSSHPLSGNRQKAFADSARPGARYTPALGDAEWRALKTICAKGDSKPG